MALCIGNSFRYLVRIVFAQKILFAKFQNARSNMIIGRYIMDVILLALS